MSELVNDTNETDPRLLDKCDQRIINAMIPFGLNKTAKPTLTKDIPTEEKINAFSGMEKMFQPLMAATGGNNSNDAKVNTEVITIKGIDNNDITLYITTPKHSNNNSKLPCVLHFHGGGMCILSANDAQYINFRQQLALQGMIVIGVEFRNIAGANGSHRYPAGLNDCMSALEWVHSQRESRNISKIITCGESGGGNLSCAVALKAKRDNKLNQLDGVYAFCPYIYGLYGEEIPEAKKLPSLVDYDGLFMNTAGTGVMAGLYLPDNETPQNNPLAWPYWASDDDVKGLPPHVISVNELDILRDEGIAYYRKLNKAGVRSRCICVGGTVHASETSVFLNAIPDITNAAVASVANFANNL